MTGTGFLRRFTRGGWMAFALIALLARAVIPTGFMVAHDPETGRAQIVLCGGTNAAPAVPTQQHAAHSQMHTDGHAAHAMHGLDHGGRDGEHNHSNDHANLCPNSVAAGTAITASPPTLAVTAQIALPADTAPRRRAEIRVFGFQPHAPSTGPPSLLA